MFGKSAGAGLVALGVIALVTACAHNVPQDSASGPDATPKGAKPINLENGEGKAKGIVTYPGGDRVDWMVFELPPNIRGQIDVKLEWRPPRPGLKLAFDVFDEYITPIVQSMRTSRKRSSSRSRAAAGGGAGGGGGGRGGAGGRGDAG